MRSPVGAPGAPSILVLGIAGFMGGGESCCCCGCCCMPENGAWPPWGPCTICWGAPAGCGMAWGSTPRGDMMGAVMGAGGVYLSWACWMMMMKILDLKGDVFFFFF